METQRGNKDGTATFVVAWVVHMLQVAGREESAPQVYRIKSLDDFFGTVGESAVSEEETKPAEC
jgi:hypothetical protein